MSPKPILITGATGFLGHHLVEQLLSRQPEQRLRLLCRGASRWDGDPRIEIARGDIVSPVDVMQAVGGTGGVYHLAGMVSRDPSCRQQLYRVHIEGTRNVCEAALRHRTGKIVVVSSSGTIAVSRERVEHDETAAYKNDIVAEWPYYLSKIYEEKLALWYEREHQLAVVVVNPSLLLGPGDVRGSSTGDIAMFLEGYIKSIPLGGLNFVDVRDAAAGLMGAMQHGRAGERYLLGGPNWTFRQLIQNVSQLAGIKAPSLQLSLNASLAGARLMRTIFYLAGKRYPLDDASIKMSALYWYCKTDKARTGLGFQTRDPMETLADTIEDVRQRVSKKTAGAEKP